jgi:hypothetical protein
MGKAVTKLEPEEEKKFQGDYAKYSKNTGMSANPDDKEHYYDYRGAWKSGIDLTSKDVGDHLDSQHKLPGHPRTYVNPKTDEGSTTPKEGYDKTYKKGGNVRGHGCEVRGKTRGKMI